MGVVVGDALGSPVQFQPREEVALHPVTGMRGGGFGLPAGSWTDDSSLTLALLNSIAVHGGIDLQGIMENFVDWLDCGAFTPYGEAYDIGRGTMDAIGRYKRNRNPIACGGTAEWNNGNGSLMRILPACLYGWAKRLGDEEAVGMIHQVGSLTHGHIRANIACGLYFFLAKAVLDGEGPLGGRLRTGLDRGFAYYDKALADHENLAYYDRLRDAAAFAALPPEKIGSSGYVVDALEAAVWSLLRGDTYESTLLTAVNLGDDSDTVGAIAGGLAGLFYGEGAIPEEWRQAIARREWIEGLCDEAEKAMHG